MMSTKKYRIRLTTDEQQELNALVSRGRTAAYNRDCPDQTDSYNHVTLWDGSNYKRAA